MRSPTCRGAPLRGSALWAVGFAVLLVLGYYFFAERTKLDVLHGTSSTSTTTLRVGVAGPGGGRKGGGTSEERVRSHYSNHVDIQRGVEDEDDLLMEAGPEVDEGEEGASDAEKGQRRLIRYPLLQGRPFRHRYSQYSCRPNPGVVEPLPANLRQSGVLDFFPEISTDLSVAVVGDSVGIQIAQVLEEALGSVREHRVAFEETPVANLVVSGPVRGGGAFLSARVNGMLWRELQTRGRALRRRTSRRRLRSELRVGGDGSTTTNDHSTAARRRRRKLPLAPQPWNRSNIEAALQWPVMRGGRVDVLVQRVTFPWTPLDMITAKSLERNTRMAAELFGMHTLVYVNYYFCSHVFDPATHETFREKLQLVRNFTQLYVPPPHSTLQHVLLLDMATLVDQLNEENARSLGYDVANEPFEQWMMSHYLATNHGERHHYHALVCGKRVPDNATSCPRNMNFVEGMHFCPSTLGGRIAAGIACLIECSVGPTVEGAAPPRRAGPASSRDDDTSALRECERHCNDKFMSLAPVPLSEMVPYNRSSET